MKMRKKLAALLAAAMIASVMPMSAFAASTNKVTKTVTVKKDATIKVAAVPELKVEVKDALPTNQSFYLHLTGAEWASVDEANTTEDLLGALKNFNIGNVLSDPAKKKIVYFEVADKSNPAAVYVFQAYRESGKTIAIKNLGVGEVGDVDLDKEIIPSATQDYLGTIVFPMLAKVKDSEAIVEVDRYDTEISDSKHTFAVSDANRANVVVGKTPNLYRSGKIADITLEERYASSIADVAKGERWFTLELRDTDYTFQVGTGAKLVGERAYRGNEEALATGNYALSKDNTKLAVKISEDMTKGKSSLQRGNFRLEGVQIVADRDARMGEVQAVIDGNFVDKATIVIANRGDYKTKLDVPKDWKYDVVAGTEKEVKFTITEELANSLVGSRPVTFTFDKGVKIKEDVTSTSKDFADWVENDFLFGTVKPGQDTKLDTILAMPEGTAAEKLAKEKALYNWIKGVEATSPTDRSILSGKIEVNGSDVDKVDKGNWSKKTTDSPTNLIAERVYVSKDRSSFTVEEFKLDPAKAGKYTFTTTVIVPAGVEGDITVEATGKGITEDKIVVLKAEAPVTVEATTMDIKVGLKEIETTGKITIKETEKDRLAQGKDIVLRIDDIDSGLKIKSFKATVVEGDLVLNDKNDPYSRWSDKAIGVKRVSTEPSTIEITDIVMSTDRTVPEGKYNLLVGGDAISRVTGKVELSKDDNYDIDPVAVVKDFINITTKNTEDISGSANKAVVSFTVGADQLLVNGKAEAMDAPPFIKDGNTMVPVRYVATALGVDEDKVIWDGPNQTATIIADKVVQVKLGSKAMSVNGVSIPMDASAELVNDRTFVPMGAIARALDVRVDWDNDTKTATFNPAK